MHLEKAIYEKEAVMTCGYCKINETNLGRKLRKCSRCEKIYYCRLYQKRLEKNIN